MIAKGNQTVGWIILGFPISCSLIREYMYVTFFTSEHFTHQKTFKCLNQISLRLASHNTNPLENPVCSQVYFHHNFMLPSIMKHTSIYTTSHNVDLLQECSPNMQTRCHTVMEQASWSRNAFPGLCMFIPCPSVISMLCKTFHVHSLSICDICTAVMCKTLQVHSLSICPCISSDIFASTRSVQQSTRCSARKE